MTPTPPLKREGPQESVAQRIRKLERRLQLEEQRLLQELALLYGRMGGMQGGQLRLRELEDVRRELRMIARELNHD